MGIQKSLSVLDNVVGWTRKKEEIKSKSKVLSDVITVNPVNAVIMCKNYKIGKEIIEKLYKKLLFNDGRVTFYGSARILIDLSHHQMSSIRVVTPDDYYCKLLGSTINFLLFTKDIDDDIMMNIIKKLYLQMPHDGSAVISRINKNKI